MAFLFRRFRANDNANEDEGDEDEDEALLNDSSDSSGTLVAISEFCKWTLKAVNLTIMWQRHTHKEYMMSHFLPVIW